MYVALLDIQKAIDTVWHNRLFHKLLTYGVWDQFSSVHFDLITQEMLHLQLIGGFHAGPGPH